MTQDGGKSAGGAAETPIDTFSNCHVGILAHLDTLGELPYLAAAAARARSTATVLLSFFEDAVLAHHSEEEGGLFPAVLASARVGDERTHVEAVVGQLTREHREIEAAWSKLKPALKLIAKGRDVALDEGLTRMVIQRYRAHADFEEQVFLPLSCEILGRNGDHMAALGAALHMRHVLPQVLARYAGRI